MVEVAAKAAHDSLMASPENSRWPESAFSVDAELFREAARAALEAVEAMPRRKFKSLPKAERRARNKGYLKDFFVEIYDLIEQGYSAREVAEEIVDRVKGPNSPGYSSEDWMRRYPHREDRKTAIVGLLHGLFDFGKKRSPTGPAYDEKV